MGNRLSKRTGTTLLHRAVDVLGSHWRDTTSLSPLSITHSTGLRVELDCEGPEQLVYIKFGIEGEYGTPRPFSTPHPASSTRAAVALAQQITDMLISEHMNPSTGPSASAEQDRPDTEDTAAIAKATSDLLACTVAPGNGPDEFELLLSVLDSVKVTVAEETITFRLRHFGQAEGPMRAVYPAAGESAAEKGACLAQAIVRALLHDRERLADEFATLRNRAAKARALLS
ncbi:hypothetical protein ACFQ0M_48260 [Kitasatospora aburaviensis]|uniref:Uncharacterized protein n=1 Tax=Kitasatospora aburaviensis TaxID=67265 RepID=A0ABW1EYW2_9ACTN